MLIRHFIVNNPRPSEGSPISGSEGEPEVGQSFSSPYVLCPFEEELKIFYLHEPSAESFGLDVKNLGLENGSRVVDLLNNKTVSERRNVQHIQKSSGRSVDTLSLLDDIHGRLKNNKNEESITGKKAVNKMHNL